MILHLEFGFWNSQDHDPGRLSVNFDLELDKEYLGIFGKHLAESEPDIISIAKPWHSTLYRSAQMGGSGSTGAGSYRQKPHPHSISDAGPKASSWPHQHPCTTKIPMRMAGSYPRSVPEATTGTKPISLPRSEILFDVRGNSIFKWHQQWQSSQEQLRKANCNSL